MRGRALGASAAALAFVAVSASAGDGPGAAGSDLPRPDFDRVDHAKPERCLEIDAAFARPERARALAAPLKRASDGESLAAIQRWVAKALRYDDRAAYAWRDLERMLADGTYGGCADHASVFGTLARACGIPTVWVKTMDLSWIDDFRAGRPFPSWSGHVFLEVFVRGAWRLLDAQGGTLYETYDPSSRLLPGERFAYDKGGKPSELLLSTRWAEWKRQTSDYFRALDERLLPWARPHGVLDAYVAGNSPGYAWAAAALESAGFRVRMSFNDDFDLYLARARGQTVVVTCSDGRPVLPENLREAWLPAGWSDALAKPTPARPAFLLRRLDDGTRVVLVLPESREAVEKAIVEAVRE